MKLLATDIFDFNSWYRFNQLNITEEMVIDLNSIDEIPSEKLFDKIGPFQEDSDRFFVSIKTENLKRSKNSDVYAIPINSIHSIIPFNEKAKRILANKFPNFKIADSLNPSIANKIFKQRDQYFAKLGGKMVLSIFNIAENYQNYEQLFINGLHKYNNELKSDSLIESLISYERSRPYPNDDSGFLFDVGSIAKTHFNISDSDLKFKEDLKTQDVDKYELIEEVLSLSVFLQKNNSQGVFGPLIKEMEKSEWLKKLNSDLNLISENSGVNNLLVIAFYLKFRYLIRNTVNLLESDFQNQINHILKHAEKEASIALFLNGLFFGSLKFRELYYETFPLPFSKEKLTTPPVKKYESTLNKEKEPITSKEKTKEKIKPTPNSDKKIEIILNCFTEKHEIDLQELKDEIKEKTGDTLGRGFKQLKKILDNIPNIIIDEKSSPQRAKLKKGKQRNSQPDLFTQ